MKKNRQTHWYFLILISFLTCKGQNQISETQSQEEQIQNELSLTSKPVKVDTLYIKNAPNNITRTIIEDKAGNIWFATFKGIFKYDGKAFTNISKEVSKSRFFSVLEDRQSNLWFGSIGAGVYYYDGTSLQNFASNNGLINKEVFCIYEDKAGNIWFGADGGASKYNGKTFQNYIIRGDSLIEDKTGAIIPNLQSPPNEVNSIIEDKKGRIWLGTRGNAFVYDGNAFTRIKHSGKPFNNVRSIIEDKKGNIWLGGNNGLWCYDGITFTNYTEDFVGHIYEDSQGNIWTSSAGAVGWVLSRYDINYMHKVSKTATEIKLGEGMFFGILEDSDGNIWSGTLGGACLYDGDTFTYLRDKI